MHKKHLSTVALLFACSLVANAQRDTLILNEVVVTGARTGVNRNNVPMTISVVSRAEIEESSESALLPVLSERIPGMFITERGVTGFGVSSGASGGISMRGVGGSPTTEVLVLIDGHPQYMGLMGHHLPDAYVASDVEKVEVIRGPGSILYGSNAMGGVINIITRKQNRDGWNANGRLMYGSHNTQKYMANAGLRKGKYDGFVSINHDQTDGHRDNSDFKITNGYARSGYNFSENIRLWGDVSIASYKALNPGTISAPVIDNIADILRGVASATLENRSGQNDGALKLFYNWGEHKINEGYLKNGGSPLPTRFHSNDRNFGALLYQNFRPFEGNIITAGVDFKSFGGRVLTEFVNGSPDLTVVDTTIYEIAGYLIVQQTLFEKLTLNGGLRLDHNEVAGSEWIPQIGFAYRPCSNTVVKGSVAKGFRNPTIKDLYLFPPHNPNLKSERMVNYELSVEQKFLDGRLSAEFTGFIADGSNLIVVQPPQPPTILHPLNVNTGDFLNRGIELAVNWHATKNLYLHGNYSYLDTDKALLYAPKHKAFFSASYHLQKWNMSAGYQFVDEVYSSITAATPIAPATSTKSTYGLLNAKVSYRPVNYLDFFVKGENLTDKKYEIMSGYPMPGFTVLGGVNISLAR
ncbi:TonB-dependent receptor plug domain-containing protein [Viscerimonas tarda]